ncbi:MAG TPA: FAD-dependent oxidoreductase [Phycisphaeraceae bacterium]
MSDRYDVAVIGAGPAGAMAAHQTAQRGARVLLVDKARFPRPKVCGGCLSAQALRILHDTGLCRDDDPPLIQGPRLHALHLACGRHATTIDLPSGLAVCRSSLDAALARAAQAAGATFLDGVTASLDAWGSPYHRIALRVGGGATRYIEARVVLVADGLAGTFLPDEPAWRSCIARHALIGLGAIADGDPAFYQPGVIYMACGFAGYVGLVRLGDGRLNMAAAVQPDWVRARGGPGRAVASLLEQAGWPGGESLISLRWRGTPALTRYRSSVARQRLFVLGDAAGYAEPFTGEGIAQALRSGVMAATLALRAAQRWESELARCWQRWRKQTIGSQQRRCWWITQALRRPWLVRTAITALACQPRLAQRWARRIAAPQESAAHHDLITCS